jgi:acyl dehydratase
MPRIITSRADVESLVGQDLGHSDGLVIDQQRIDRFAEATDDHQWIHVNPDRARSGPFGQTVAHGYLTLALVPRLTAEIFTLDFGSARLNYGSEKVRFPSPVSVGSTVRASATFVDVRSRPHGTQITTRVTITADGADKPACITEAMTLVIDDVPGEEQT